MLSIPNQIILVQMLNYLITENCFHDFTYLARKADWSIIVNFMLSTFLNRGETLAVLQSPGTHPVSRDLRKRIVTGTAISSHNAFNIRGDMLSAPAALSSFNFWSLLVILSTLSLVLLYYIGLHCLDILFCAQTNSWSVALRTGQLTDWMICRPV